MSDSGIYLNVNDLINQIEQEKFAILRRNNELEDKTRMLEGQIRSLKESIKETEERLFNTNMNLRNINIEEKSSRYWAFFSESIVKDKEPFVNPFYKRDEAFTLTIEELEGEFLCGNK